jgi:hypothetical protein
MSTVDIVFRTSRWEGYDSSVRSFEDEASALHAVIRSMNKNPKHTQEYVYKIIVSRPAEDEFSLEEVKNLFADLSAEPLAERLYRSEAVTLGSNVFTRVDCADRTLNQRDGNDIWVVFEYRNKTYKWSGTHYSTGNIWNPVETLTETRKEEKVHTIVSWS